MMTTSKNLKRKKPTLSFYTNIPTPYQLSFFIALSKLFDLRVIYYSQTENNRSWKYEYSKEYQSIILKDGMLARFLQQKIVDFHFSREIFKVLRHDESQFIIVGGSYWIPNALAIFVWSRLRNRKIAYFSEPLFETRNTIKFLLKKLMLQVINICCDYLFCVGKKAETSFKHYGVKTPTHIIRYNIDVSQFQKLDQDILSKFKNLYNSEDNLVILTSGALIERKGIDVVLQAVKLVNYSSLSLLVLGDGSEKEALLRIANNDSRVRFLGFISPGEIPYFFGLAHIFIFASRYDGWGVVINEAIAANIPIISSNMVGASIDLIQSGENGFICESGNVTEFSKSIEELLLNIETYNRIKNNALKLIPLISSEYNAQKVYDVFTS